MESLERFVMLATSNDITRAAVDHGHVSGTQGFTLAAAGLLLLVTPSLQLLGGGGGHLYCQGGGTQTSPTGLPVWGHCSAVVCCDMGDLG